jgi:hypothetical protein
MFFLKIIQFLLEILALHNKIDRAKNGTFLLYFLIFDWHYF